MMMKLENFYQEKREIQIKVATEASYNLDIEEQFHEG